MLAQPPCLEANGPAPSPCRHECDPSRLSHTPRTAGSLWGARESLAAWAEVAPPGYSCRGQGPCSSTTVTQSSSLCDGAALRRRDNKPSPPFGTVLGWISAWATCASMATATDAAVPPPSWAEAESALHEAPVTLFEQAAAIVVDDIEPAEMTALLGAMVRVTDACGVREGERELGEGAASPLAARTVLIETDFETRAPAGHRLHLVTVRPHGRLTSVAAFSAGSDPSAQVRLRVAAALGEAPSAATPVMSPRVILSNLETRRAGAAGTDIRSWVRKRAGTPGSRHTARANSLCARLRAACFDA